MFAKHPFQNQGLTKLRVSHLRHKPALFSVFTWICFYIALVGLRVGGGKGIHANIKFTLPTVLCTIKSFVFDPGDLDLLQASWLAFQ